MADFISEPWVGRFLAVAVRRDCEYCLEAIFAENALDAARDYIKTHDVETPEKHKIYEIFIADVDLGAFAIIPDSIQFLS